MHGDHGLTMVFRGIKKEEDYGIEGLQKAILILIEKFKKEVSNLTIETYIKPIINIFQDSTETNCMAILLGYGYSYKCSEKKRMEAITDFNLKLCSFGLIITIKYLSVIYCEGDCYDSSFVENFRHGRIHTVTLSPEGFSPRTDEYSWEMMDYKTSSSNHVESSTIYSLFPLDKITLPKIEKGLHIKVPPHKVFEASMKEKDKK